MSRAAGQSTAIAFVVLTLFCGTASATGGSPPQRLRVVTQNLYIGADLDILFDAASPAEIPLQVAKFLQFVQSTNFPERAKKLAALIKEKKPHVIALQEVAWYRFQGTGDFATGMLLPNAEVTIIDFLEVLLAELNAGTPQYRVAAVVRNADVELPGAVDLDHNGIPDDIRLTDRDVILAKVGVRISNATAGTYNALRLFDLDLGTSSLSVPVKRGFVTVDATIGGETHLIANTHLENKSGAPQIQAAQAADLISELNSRNLPVVLAGDINSGPADPLPTNPIVAPYWQFLDAGFLDAWEQRHNYHASHDNAGYTCCQDDSLRNPESTLDKRIDVVLFRPAASGAYSGPWDVRARVIGNKPEDKTPSGMWPSDHAGFSTRIGHP